MVFKKVQSTPVFPSSGLEEKPASNQKSVPLELLLESLRNEHCDCSRPMTQCSDTSQNSNSSNSVKAEFYIGEETLPSPSIQSPATEFKHPLKAQTVTVQIPNADEKTIPPEKPIPMFVPPDGDYGWVIAFSACTINIFVFGLLKSYGILHLYLMQRFPDASAYQASWLLVFLSTLGLLIAPVVGILCRKFTSRKVSFVGGLLCFSGLFLGAFATSMTQMIFTFGLLTGFGAGLTTTPGVLITSLYFDKRRGFASAICISGNAIGAMIFPHLIKYLLSNYGLKGTFCILAALQLHICAVSMLYRPITVHAQVQQRMRLRTKKSLNEETKGLESPLYERKLSIIADNLYKKVSLRRMASIASSVDDDEVRYQLSFLRTSSMMNSIPDLAQYARSWSYEQGVSGNEHSSCKLVCKGNKQSNHSLLTNTKSNAELEGKLSSSEQLSLSRELSKRMSKGRKRMQSLPESELDSESNLYLNGCPEMLKQNLPDEVIASDTDAMIQSTDQNLNGKTMLSDEKDNLDIKSKPNKFKPGCCTLSESSIFRNSLFWLITVASTLVAAGAPHAIFFFPVYAASVNIDERIVINLLSISSAVDLVGRLGMGFFADLNFVRSSLLYAISAGTAGAVVLMIPSSASNEGLATLLSFYGIAIGAWLVLLPTLLAEHHGAQRLAASYGIARMFHGIMNFISPQVCGLLIDLTGNYSSIYYFMGTCMTIAAVITLTEPIIIASQRKKQQSLYDV